MTGAKVSRADGKPCPRPVGCKAQDDEKEDPHGRAPKDAGYAYAIRPDTAAAALAEYANAPDLEIVRRDDAAHIVRFPSRGITGYALFSPASGISFGPVHGADTPCLVMTRVSGNQLMLSVADPDLRLPPRSKRPFDYEPGATATLRLQLNGKWRIRGTPDGVRQVDSRTLEVTARDGRSTEVVLEPAS